MDKLFEIKLYESGLGPYNATKVTTIFCVGQNLDQVIRRLLTNDTITFEVVSVNPCIICNGL